MSENIIVSEKIKTGVRLDNGLIEGLEYIRDDKTGKINWLKMIPPEHLYLNKDKKSSIEKRLGKSIDEVQMSEALDTELIIKLSGIQWLLTVRGYEYSKITLNNSSRDFASATCEIKFIPNEEDKIGQIFCGSASAHDGNTKSWYREYLTEAASNRAICRATRFYLGISTVTSEELGAIVEEDVAPKNSFNKDKQIKLLSTLMEKKGILWKHIVTKLQDEDAKDTSESKEKRWSDSYKSIDDLPANIILELIERIKKIAT